MLLDFDLSPFPLSLLLKVIVYVLHVHPFPSHAHGVRLRLAASLSCRHHLLLSAMTTTMIAAAAALHGGTAPLAALTTVFTPPCPTSWLVTTTKIPSQLPSFPAAGTATTCDPPAWATNLSGEGFQFYSPAICPEGFEVGTNCLLSGAPRTTEGFPAVALGETVAFCVAR